MNKILKMISIVKKKDRLAILFFLLFLPLFLYNLGSYSLADYDEAWFAEVARNILVSSNPLILKFNNGLFLEHPPLGFILMSLSFKLFGINDFAARFFPAILAFFSVVILYFIGKRLFRRSVGFGASLVLLSCVWFVFRARSGNLDTIFLFFYLLTFYLALKLKDNKNYIYLVSISLSALLLSKMLIGLTIVVPIVAYIMIEKIEIKWKMIAKATFLFLLLSLPWFIANFIILRDFFVSHIILVAFRPFGRIQPNYKDLLSSITFQYLHFGIRKWYYPTLFSFIGSIFFIRRYKQLIPIYILSIIFLYGFLTNSKTEIWHLIPLYPYLGLFIAFFFYQMVFFIYKKIFNGMAWAYKMSSLTLIIFFLFVTLWQIYKFRNEIKLFDQDISGLAYVSQKARNYKEKLYLYADYFLPSAVFYSQKNVVMVVSFPYPKNTLVGFIDSGPKPYLLIGEKWKFDKDKINKDKYELIADYKEYRLIRVTK